MTEIIEEIASLWPDCRVIHGRARHSQSQGGVERLNRTVQEKLGHWMTTNDSKHWTIGRLFVRWQINTAFSKAIGDTPYRLTFGQNPRAGISTLPISAEMLKGLTTEAQVLISCFGCTVRDLVIYNSRIVRKSTVRDLYKTSSRSGYLQFANWFCSDRELYENLQFTIWSSTVREL